MGQGPRHERRRRRLDIRSVISSLAAATALLGCAVQPARVPDPAPFDALAEHLHRDFGFDGAFVVSDASGFRWERGVGMANAQEAVRFTPDTPSDGGSIAKTFTATALHMMAADGELDLDAPVARYLPAFPYADVTLRHLLSHASGLPDYAVFEAQLEGRESSNAMLLDLLAERRPPLAFAPGTRFEYSSLGYDLAALVVERVSGHSYEAFLRRWVFGPLGMTDSFVRPARLDDWRGPRTIGYSIEAGMRAMLDVFNLEGFYGGSNLYLSARDLDRWNRAWIDREVLPWLARRRGMARPVFPGGQESALNLLSWYTSADGSQAWYSGHLQGFYTMVYRDQHRDRSIVYVTNTNPPMWLRPLIVQALNGMLDGEPFRPWAQPEFVPVVDEPGVVMRRHELPGVGGLELRHRNGRRYAQLDGRPEVRVFQVAPEVLVAPGYDAWLWYTADGNGGRILHWNTVLESVSAR